MSKYNVGNVFGFSCTECEYNRHCYGGDLGNQYKFCQKSREKLENLDELEKENQKLKRQLEVGKEQYNDLVEEKEKLEQENQELKELNIAISKGLKKVTVKRNKWRNRYYKVRRENGDQQKEFIEWLEQNIENEEYCYLAQKPGERCRKDVFEEVLSKYKEIIGGKK